VKEPDYYSILKIDSDASLEEVRSAYKRLALLTHPDLSGHPQANQQMQRLNEAFEVLSNPEKRAQYDQDRSAASTLTPVEKPAPAGPEAQVDRKQQKDLGRKWNRLVRNQLKMIAYIVLLTTAMFFWSLASGRVNIMMILLIVGLTVFSLVSMILKVRKLDS
jgi:hypothetical protein